MCENNELGVLTGTEIKIIQEYRERYMKCGDFWLTPEGRAEIRDCWKNPNDGNIVLPLLNELERLENLLSVDIQSKTPTGSQD
jgi:hypothetical protein